jgi:type IV pilus assembly protein PilV
MLVAMILLGVGVSALAHSNGQTIVMQTLAQNRTNAIAIGRGYLEQVRSRDPWTVESEAAINVDASGAPSPNGSYRRALQVTASRQNLLTVEVRVDFPRGTTPIVLKTMLFRGNGLSGVD